MKINPISILNRYEKIYVILFVCSMFAGIINGAINRQYFTCCEDSIGVPEGGTSTLKIFQNNFLLSLTELMTAGLASLYYNFHTFSLTSSYLISQNALFMVIFILALGIFELAGSVLMGLVGFTFIERKLFRIKSKLSYATLFLSGVSLIFIGAAIEYALLRPLM